MPPPERQDRKIVNMVGTVPSNMHTQKTDGHCNLPREKDVLVEANHFLHDIGLHALYLECYGVPAGLSAVDLTNTLGSLPYICGSVYTIAYPRPVYATPETIKVMGTTMTLGHEAALCMGNLPFVDKAWPDKLRSFCSMRP